ncbi:unnamed protein product [Protopolystoma xenopodis]|uniref:CBS domain-containing protein n=1 Tax=Protopolystoma xenopodis TaxID=117903 RepID=A0A3S5APZ2_9PLAT|nr:unnamed protein product [Protopolystoma xenopodis]
MMSTSHNCFPSIHNVFLYSNLRQPNWPIEIIITSGSIKDKENMMLIDQTFGLPNASLYEAATFVDPDSCIESPRTQQLMPDLTACDDKENTTSTMIMNISSDPDMKTSQVKISTPDANETVCRSLPDSVILDDSCPDPLATSTITTSSCGEDSSSSTSETDSSVSSSTQSSPTESASGASEKRHSAVIGINANSHGNLPTSAVTPISISSVYQQPLASSTTGALGTVQPIGLAAMAQSQSRLASVSPGESLFRALRLLARLRIHRLPVLDEARLGGTGNILYLLTHARLLAYLYQKVYILPRPKFLRVGIIECST